MLYLQNHFLSFFPFSINPKTILSLSLSLGLPTSLHLHRSLFHSIRDPSQSPLQSILRTEARRAHLEIYKKRGREHFGVTISSCRKGSIEISATHWSIQ
ncbi:hypothetical protein IHE45_16G080600 [Dioscorea alata]|uniref:Uncharacterized protein n=1 Tax=Dioscorea alata TaxID=55571 RepID=A0ACB7UIH5_DIOAL|nr:hypothetical protein IHE45_16G080600 [Dioscorea alata]